MDSSFQIKLISTIKKLSRKLGDLNIHHDYLNNIHSKLSSLATKDDSLSDDLQLSINECSSLYNVDQTLTINYMSASSHSTSDDLFSDALDDISPDLGYLKISNSNCSENLLKYRFANENFHCVTEEETIETPFFKLKNSDDDRSEIVKECVGTLEVVIFFSEDDFCEYTIFKNPHLVEWNYQSVLKCNIIDSFNDLFYYYHPIITIDQPRKTKKMTTLKENIEPDQCYMIYEHLYSDTVKSMDIIKGASTEHPVLSIERSQPFYVCYTIQVNNIAHMTSGIIIDVINFTTNYSHTSCHRLSTIADITGLICCRKSIRIELNCYTSVSLQRTICLNFQTTMTTQKGAASKMRKIDHNKPDNDYQNFNEAYKQFDVSVSDFSDFGRTRANIAQMTKDRKLTLSEKRWHIMLKTSLLAIYRKITSEMFHSNTYNKPSLYSREKGNNIRSSMQCMSEICSVALKLPRPTMLPELPQFHLGGVIKLNSIDLIEQRLNTFNEPTGQLETSKNIFEIKRLLKSKMLNNATDNASDQIMEPSYFTCSINDKVKQSDEVTVKCNKCDTLSHDLGSDSSDTIKESKLSPETVFRNDNTDRILRSDSNEKSELDFENVDLDYFPSSILSSRLFPKTRLTGHESLRQCFSSISIKQSAMDDNYQSVISETLPIIDDDFYFKDLRRSRSLSESKNRFIKSTQPTGNDRILDKDSFDDRSFTMNTLREKAVMCILKAKKNIDVDNRKRSSKLSAHIDKFIGNQEVGHMENYQCANCCRYFKLGTELRQHKRSHNCH